MILYLDTSGLLKLYVQEDGSAEVREKVETAAHVVVAMVAYAEARAAFAALRRRERLGPSALGAAKRALAADWPQYRRIAVSEATCLEAGELAERFALRGYDSIQLACYAQLVRASGEEAVVFCCFDSSLKEAAEKWRTREGRRI